MTQGTALPYTEQEIAREIEGLMQLARIGPGSVIFDPEWYARLAATLRALSQPKEGEALPDVEGAITAAQLKGWVLNLRHYVDTYTARDEYDYQERSILAGIGRALSSPGEPTEPTPEEDPDKAHRYWALARVAKHREVLCDEHQLHDGIEAKCYKCWHVLGRREGQAEAGAYYTMDEAMARLRLRAPLSGGDAPGNPLPEPVQSQFGPREKNDARP